MKRLLESSRCTIALRSRAAASSGVLGFEFLCMNMGWIAAQVMFLLNTDLENTWQQKPPRRNGHVDPLTTDQSESLTHHSAPIYQNRHPTKTLVLLYPKYIC